MPTLPPALIARIDNQIIGLNNTQKILEGTSKAVAQLASNAAWYVGVVTPGFLGLMWNAKQLSETFRFGPSWFFVFFIAAQLCFLASIVCSMFTHHNANLFVGMIAEHSLHIIGMTNDYEQAKTSEELKPRLFQGEADFRIKLHDMEVKLDKGPARYVKFAEKAYAPAGIIGYLIVGTIFALTTFAARPCG